MRTWDPLFNLFEAEGAELTAAPGLVPFGDGFNSYPPLDQPFDVVIANLAHDPMNGPLDQLKDDSWQALFDTGSSPNEPGSPFRAAHGRSRRRQDCCGNRAAPLEASQVPRLLCS